MLDRRDRRAGAHDRAARRRCPSSSASLDPTAAAGLRERDPDDRHRRQAGRLPMPDAYPRRRLREGRRHDQPEPRDDARVRDDRRRRSRGDDLHAPRRGGAGAHGSTRSRSTHCTSTNDTVLLFASGAAGDAGVAPGTAGWDELAAAVGEVGESLAAPARRRRRGRHARDAGRGRGAATRRATRARIGRRRRGLAAREDRHVRRRPEPRPDPAGGRRRRRRVRPPEPGRRGSATSRSRAPA